VNQSTQKGLAITAFTGVGLSLIVHVTTFFGVDLMQSISWIWVLHIGIFVLFFLMNPSFRAWHINWNDFFSPMPYWTKTLAGIFFIYAFINFAIFFFLSKDGSPEIINGKYVLQSGTLIIKELTESEYHWQQAYILRGFSGHWMIGYLIPALYFWYPKPSSRLKSMAK
jgi:hypothetical protein